MVRLWLAGHFGTASAHLPDLALHHNRKLVDRTGITQPLGPGVGSLVAGAHAFGLAEYP